MDKKITISSFAIMITILVALVIYQEIDSDHPQREISSEAHPNYCLAIRGNGDYQPAHWGAMATTVEKLGLPQAMAGGSSATVSMFLLESIAKNPIVEKASAEDQKVIASFLLKSLLGMSEQIQTSTVWKTSLMLYQQYKYLETRNFTKMARKLVMSNDWAQLQKHIEENVAIVPINDQVIALMYQAIDKQDTKQFRFYLNEVENSAKVFGRFDAKNDANLFFRFGIVSFEKMAHLFGKIAGFYSAEGDSIKTKNAWKKLVTSCSADSVGKTWTEIITAKPVCHQLFADVYNSHFEDTSNKHQAELNIAGQKISVFPSTAVLIGSEASRYNKAFAEYIKLRDENYGTHYQIKNASKVVFGYWGNPEVLEKIKNNLDPLILKNKKFFALGEGTWKEILSLSPAEPGLSNLKPFTKNKVNYVSAGGWSDLAPTLVLKASGCENVVYLTRQGGESLFAQGVAKRLLKLDIGWDKLDTSNAVNSKANTAANDLGRPEDIVSTWSKLYNVANSESSIRASLAEASAILCTDWNNHDPKANLVDAIESSYKSPFVLAATASLELKQNLNPKLDQLTSGCKY